MRFVQKIAALFCLISMPILSFSTPEEADSTCNATQILPFFPVDIRSQSTCNAPNDFSSLNCGTIDYLKGNDKLYRIMPLFTQRVDLFLINLKDVYTSPNPREALSLFVLDDCPGSGGKCVDFSEGDHSVKVTGIVLQAFKTYYIVVSSREKCVDYSLLIKPSMQYDIDNMVEDPGFDHMAETTCGYQVLGSNLNTYSTSWSTPNQASTDVWSLLRGAPVCLTNPRSTNVMRLGNQEPHSGHAFAGIMVTPGSTGPYREYVQSKLSQPLIPGQMYEASWYISLAEKSSLTSQNWGAYFSKQKVDTIGYSLVGFTPQLQANVIVRDTNSWVRISSTFTAQEASEYMNIGFFSTPTQTSWNLTGHGNMNSAYYFIDDVELKPIFPVILPVTEVSLSAFPLPTGHVKVGWASWDEKLMSHYEVERAGPDGTFVSLGQTILATGAPQEMATYAYEDVTTFGLPELHYRLRMVDLDGGFAYSDVVSVFQSQDEQRGQVGPNPFRNEMAITWQHTGAGAIDVQVVNVAGQRVRQQAYHRDAGVQKLLVQNLSDLPPGAYFVHVMDENHQETYRLLKQ